MLERARPLLQLTRSRVMEFLREPEAVFWVFGFPILTAVVLGLAFRSKPVEGIPVAVVAEGTASNWALEVLTETPGIKPRRLEAATADQELRAGRLELVVVAEWISPGTTGVRSLLYRYDPTGPQGETARLLADDALQRAAGREDAVRVDEERITAAGSRYIDFLIPGLIGLNLMGSGMWGLGFAVVQMRVRKVLKRFAATPMRRSDFLLSLMMSRLIFLGLELVFLVAFGWLVFGVAVRGSILDLALISLIGSLSFTGIATLVAARPKSIEVATGWMNFIMIPMWLCSGSFFAYSRFPAFLQPPIRALPLTALNDALRAIMNEGLPLWSTWQEILVMAAWGGLSFALALKIFRWQ